MGPNQVHNAVNQLISFLSMPFGKPVADVPAEIERILANEVRWLQETIGDATDAKGMALCLGEKLGKGLNLNAPDISAGFADGARLQARNVLYFCWMALPEARRTSAETERVVRMVISRELSLGEEIRRELIEGP
jgi:hypothetical protein